MITVKGQATIPKAVRDRLGIGPGDRLKFFFHPDGSVVLLPKRPVGALRGLVQAQRTVSLDEMNEAIAVSAAERTHHRKRS